MAILLTTTIGPAGDFPLVEAKDVGMPNGVRLPEAIPKIKTVTKGEYEALVKAGEDDPDVYYMIARDDV